MSVPDLGFFSNSLAVAIGLYEAIVLNKLQWCVESPLMSGTVIDGQKWIRNPIVCTDPDKQDRAQEHGKAIDWLSNFPFLKPYLIRKVFNNLEQLGLVISRQWRAGKWDRCKYYTINKEKLAELLKPLEISICRNTVNRFDKSEHIDLLTNQKSYQYSCSEKVIQKSLTERASGTVLVNLEHKYGDSKDMHRDNVNYQVAKEQDSIIEPTILQVEKCSAPSSSVNRQKFYEALLAYCYQRVDIDKPEGYATWVMKESKSKAPEASVAMLWDEFNAGEELGSRLVPAGYRLRGVPEQVVMEAISQDCVSKVGATATEAAKTAAGQFRRLPVVAAVANAVKLQLERCIESAKRQVELGIPKEQAILNNLPTYAVACDEDSIPRIAASETVETPVAIDATDPYALTEENRAARSKAFEAIQAVKTIGAKLPKRQTKREQILAMNLAEAAESIKLIPTKTEAVVKSTVQESIEDEPILW